jgi:DNA-binding transcriptional MerR regulator
VRVNVCLAGSPYASEILEKVVAETSWQTLNKPLTSGRRASTLRADLSKYRIHTVAQMTGLSPALIRAWESRYSLVVPVRTPAGYRLYSDEDVAILNGAQRLLRLGMAPMQVAKLTPEEIRGERPEDKNSDHNKDRDKDASLRPFLIRDHAEPTPAELPALSSSYSERIARLVDAFATFDKRRAEELLSPPLAMLPLATACEKLLVPLLREVGERWHRGELSIAAEHFGSSFIRKKLNTLLDTLRNATGDKRVCCACPPGELHELGLLMFTLNAAAQGWEPIYLGPDLPIADLASAVARMQPELVGLSFVQRREPAELTALLNQIIEGVAGRSAVLVGGLGLAGLSEVVLASGALLMPESGRLDDLFRSRPLHRSAL